MIINFILTCHRAHWILVHVVAIHVLEGYNFLSILFMLILSLSHTHPHIHLPTHTPTHTHTHTHTPAHRLPLLKPPYLHSMHNSPVKSVELRSDVSRELLQTLSQVGRVQQEAVYRARAKVGLSVCTSACTQRKSSVHFPLKTERFK